MISDSIVSNAISDANNYIVLAADSELACYGIGNISRGKSIGRKSTYLHLYKHVLEDISSFKSHGFDYNDLDILDSDVNGCINMIDEISFNLFKTIP